MALTKIVASRSGHRTTLIPFPGTIDDGSTLSLDFTTGVLDPRLTFTRSTNATFINSSGLVQYADANLLSNSVWTDANATPTNWTLWTASGGTVSIPESGLRTISATAASQQPFLYQNYLLNQGLSYTISVVVTNVSGSVKIENVLAVISASSIVGYYVNGILQTNTTNQATAGKYAVVFVASGASHSVRFGAASQNLTTGACSITMHSPRLQPGIEVNPSYVASQIGSSYQGPRFDYDPTTLAPRGLLIEGSASNLLFWSESFATSGAAANWAYNSNTGAVVTTDNPAGGTTAFQFAETANSGPLQQSATVTNVVHTFSAWFKGSVYNSVTTTQVQFGLFTTGFVAGSASIISGPGSTSIAGNIVTLSGLSTTQWTRVQFTTSAAISGGAVAILIYPQSTAFEVNRSFHIWGAQLETGSGASSYIPTGASQGNRAFDSCVMEDITSCNYSTKTGTLFYAGRFTQMNASSFPNRFGFTRETGDLRAFYALSTTTALLPGYSNGATSVLTTQNITLNSELKLAISFDADLSTAEVKSSLNGAAIVQSGASALTESNAPTYFMLGQKGYGSYFPHGTVRSVKYWPTALPTAQLQALTT